MLSEAVEVGGEKRGKEGVKEGMDSRIQSNQ